MSKYTTEVRYICETYAGVPESQGYDRVDEIIDESQGQIFENYEIFDEAYRTVLNHKILRHYYVREICAETVGLWKLYLNNKMNEIMPYYNKLYSSALLDFNPLYDVDITTTHEGEESGENAGERDGTNQNTQTNNLTSDTDYDSTTKVRFSDTPQGGLNGMQSVEQNLYLTSATITDVDGNTTTKNTGTIGNNGTNHEESTGNFSSMKSYTERVAGKRGGLSYSKMIEEFRKTFLRIDEMIIKELEDCFFKLY